MSLWAGAAGVKSSLQVIRLMQKCRTSRKELQIQYWVYGDKTGKGVSRFVNEAEMDKFPR